MTGDEELFNESPGAVNDGEEERMDRPRVVETDVSPRGSLT